MVWHFPPVDNDELCRNFYLRLSSPRCDVSDLRVVSKFINNMNLTFNIPADVSYRQRGATSWTLRGTGGTWNLHGRPTNEEPLFCVVLMSANHPP